MGLGQSRGPTQGSWVADQCRVRDQQASAGGREVQMGRACSARLLQETLPNGDKVPSFCPTSSEAHLCLPPTSLSQLPPPRPSHPHPRPFPSVPGHPLLFLSSSHSSPQRPGSAHAASVLMAVWRSHYNTSCGSSCPVGPSKHLAGSSRAFPDVPCAGSTARHSWLPAGGCWYLCHLPHSSFPALQFGSFLRMLNGFVGL